jgi:hypothetical protein
MNVHPVERTTFSLTDYARAARIADPSLTREAVGVLWAQYALETGRGSSCWCNNIGNLKVTRAQAEAGTPLFMLPGTWEIERGRRVVYEPPHEQAWFRWFASLSEAMSHHLVFLAKRYAPAWDALRAGEPTEFATKLKSRGYYTGDEGIYAASLRHLQREFLGAVLWGVDPNEVTIASTAHGTSIVDWALARREEDRIAQLDADLCEIGIGEFCGASRYEEAA